MFFDPAGRLVEGSAARKDALDPDFLKRSDIPFGDHTTDHNHDVLHLLLLHGLHQFFTDRQMGSGHDGKTDDIHILLDGCVDNLIDGLMETRVDHLHPCIAESLCHHFCSPVMAVQARLSH